MKKKKFRLQLILSSLAVIAAAIGLIFFGRPQAAADLKVYFFDVGQGDSSYIKTPIGQDVLIDGGDDNTVLNELGKVMDFSDHEINLVILSHPHSDHLDGLIEVLKRYKVDEVWETGVAYPSGGYDTWEKEIADKKIPRKIVVAGDEKDFGDVKLTILYPLSSIEGKTFDNLNNASIINRLDYKNFSVLYTGDAEKDTEQKVLNPPAGGNLYATVLKVPHHGSENGLMEDFLKVVRPAIAIISVSQNNKFGHPNQSTLNLLKDFAVRVYRTDQNGRIEVDSDGEDYWVKTSK